jgi:moderate conductance mechanosensitive channel
MNLLIRTLLLLLVLGAPGVHAAPVTPADPLTAELETLVATLEDETARARLLAQLRGLLELQRNAATPVAESVGPRLLGRISNRLDVVGAQLAYGTALLLDVPAAAGRWMDRSADPAVRRLWLESASKLALILGLGLVVEWLVRGLLGRLRRALEMRRAATLPLRTMLLSAHCALDLVVIAVFALVAYGVLPWIDPRPTTQVLAITLINASVLARALSVGGELVFAARAPGLRLMPVSDETAHYGMIWLQRLSVVAVYGYFGAEAALLLGLGATAHGLLMKSLGLVVVAMLTVLIMQNRAAVGHWLRGGPTTGTENRALQSVRRRCGEVWHAVAILYVLVAYAVWAIELEGGFRFLLRATVLSVVVLIVARLVLLGAQRALDRIFRLGADLMQRFPALADRANRYLYVGHRVLAGAVQLCAALVLLDIWGVEVFAWLTSEAGKDLSASLVSIAFILTLALLAWELVSATVQNYLAEQDATGQVVERSARVKTLLPLLRNAMRILLVVIAALMVLAELGINIAPLLAGAGVVGLAVGFGAQSLVKDLITGVFILMEDSIAVGDVATLGAHTGVVESLTVRTIRLRDLTGTVHVLPWGEVSSVMNMTKDFSFAVMDVGVAYREDVDEVIEALKEVGADLQEDPEYGVVMLAPLEVLGLDSFGDSSVNIRVRFKTVPGKQWWARREFNRRMKRLFDARDIEIPFPHQTVYFGVDKAGAAPPARLELASDEATAILPSARRSGRA